MSVTHATRGHRNGVILDSDDELEMAVNAATAATRYPFGTHGHRHGVIIDSDDEEEHRDLRTLPAHRHARSNVVGARVTQGMTAGAGAGAGRYVRTRYGLRSHPLKGPLPGVAPTVAKLCVRCRVWKSACEFENHAVGDDLRRHDGFNITCRACQPASAQYSRDGYKLDGFIVDEASSSEDEE